MNRLGWERPLMRFSGAYWKPNTPVTKPLPSTHKIGNELPIPFAAGEGVPSPVAVVSAALMYELNQPTTQELKIPSLSYMSMCVVTIRGEDYPLHSTSLTDVIRSIQIYGYLLESDTEQPWDGIGVDAGDKLYPVAADRSTSQWSGIAQATQIYKCALFEGHPIVIGLPVYERSLDPANFSRGQLEVPHNFEWPHSGCAFLLTGWDDSRLSFRVWSPLGPEWGENGYGWIPYSQVTNSGLQDEAYVFLSK